MSWGPLNRLKILSCGPLRFSTISNSILKLSLFRHFLTQIDPWPCLGNPGCQGRGIFPRRARGGLRGGLRGGPRWCLQTWRYQELSYKTARTPTDKSVWGRMFSQIRDRTSKHIFPRPNPPTGCAEKCVVSNKYEPLNTYSPAPSAPTDCGKITAAQGTPNSHWPNVG